MGERRIAADDVARHRFTSTFRGYDQHEVRAYLGQVAAELAGSQERERLLADRLAQAEARAVPPEMGEAELDAVLGREAGKVLAAAHEAAAEIRSRAEEQVARMLREASDEASRIRQEAKDVLGRRTAEADAAAEAVLTEARGRAEGEIAAAQQQGREMVGEAQAVRERILRDLARRRRTAHVQIEQLRAGRDRLLEAYRVVRSTLDEATGELTVAEAEARAAAEVAALRLADEAEPSVEELEAEVAAARDAGLTVARPEAHEGAPPPEEAAAAEPAPVAVEPDEGDGGPPPAEARSQPGSEGDAGAARRPVGARPTPVPAAPAEPPSAGPPEGSGDAEEDHADDLAASASLPADEVSERRTSALRILRRRPPPAPVVRPPVEMGDDIEGVRIIRAEEPTPDGDMSAGESRAAGVADDTEPPPAEVKEPAAVAEGTADEADPPGEVHEPAAVAEATKEREASARTAGGGEPAEETPISTTPGGEDEADPSEISKPDVGALFARIRADRAAAVVDAEAVLAPDPDAGNGNGNGNGLAAVATAPAPEASADAGDPAEPVAGPEPGPSGPDGEDELGVDDAIRTRDSVLRPIEQDLSRALKRALADEQNEVLAGLRQAKGAVELGTLLPSEDEHTARFVEAARPAVAEAAAAGASDGPVPEVDDVSAALGIELAGALRARVERAISETAGEAEPLRAALSAAYREWKTGRVPEVARHHVTVAYARGRFAAAPEGELRWVVDPGEGRCPDCDDNALAGPTAKGAPFPTGQAHPPAHEGCRCLVVPAGH